MAKSFNARMQDRFTRITNDYAKVNLYVHETAMMIATHAKEHNDCSTAQGLIMAMPASIRREMLILWFARYTPIVVKNDDKWTSKMHKVGTKLYVEWNLEEAEANPFYKLAEENKEAAPLTFEQMVKMVEGLAKRIEKKVENGEVAPEDIESAKAVAEQISHLKLVRVKAKPAANDAEAPERKAG